MKQCIRLFHLGSKVSSPGMLSKSEFMHITYSIAFPCAILVFSLNGFVSYFYLPNHDFVFKSQCTHYFPQEVFTNYLNLDNFLPHVLLYFVYEHVAHCFLP